MVLVTDELVKQLIGGFMLYPQYRFYAFEIEVPTHFKKAIKYIRDNLDAGYETLAIDLAERYPDIYKWADIAPMEFEFENFVKKYQKIYQHSKLVERIKVLASKVQKIDLEYLQREIMQLAKDSLHKNVEVKHVGDIVNELVNELFRLHETGGIEIPYLSTLVNDLLGGELIILAGRPGMGKTTLMLNIAEKLARKDINVGIISLEMTGKPLVLKLVQRYWDFNLMKNIKNLSQEELNRVAEQLREFQELPIFISDRFSTKIESVLSSLNYFINVHGIKVFFIDYLQLIRAKIGNRVEELGYITRLLKEFAVENNVSIFLGSQLNRNVEYREDKMPSLADLRESGAIEQDADVVVMLYRPGYYNDEEDPTKLVLKVAKQRNGVVGSITVRFDLNKQIITEYD